MTEMTLDVNSINRIRSFSGEATPLFPSNKNEPENKIEKSISTHPGKKKQENIFSTAKIDDLSKKLNDYLEYHQTSMGFFIHEELDNQIVVEIKDRETGELVRQIPSEELLRIREKMLTSTGLIFDTVG